MKNSSFDVLVIGAGAAGLAAAAELAQAGRSALVLEGRNRIGGRCWSRHEPGLPVPVELGAEFIHGRPAATFSLLRKTGSTVVDAPRNSWVIQRGKLEPRADFLTEVRRALRDTGALKRKDVSFATFLARTPRQRLSQNARTFARMLVEGYDAADPARASARAIVEEWTAEGAAGASQFRPLGGYGPLLACLAGALTGSKVELRLQSVVQAVRWNRGSIEVEAVSSGKNFRATAPRAIVTLPLGVLQLAPDAPGAVRFVPALKEKQPALAALASGPALKTALRFRTAFWEELDRARYRDATFFHSPGAAIPTFWTALPVRVPLLIAWAGGPKAARFLKAKTSEIVHQALISLESVFGKGARVESRLEAAYFHHWQQDPFARGAYSYVTVGGKDARRSLAAPLQDTLFFAGEATDFEGEAATVAGALQSGARAAREVMRAR